ncbi:hypothetical protein [Streptomyces sp. NPDC090025]|uniref:hypothetical protein n=1 Tax=Streptomyces sp. NPDC090025 TaxID=3365922 RepID=UPI0038335D84
MQQTAAGPAVAPGALAARQDHRDGTEPAPVHHDRAAPEPVRHDTTARFIASSRAVLRQSLAMLEGLIDHLEHMASNEAALAADLKAAEQALLRSLGERDRLVSAHHEAVAARLRAEAEYGRANGRAAELAADLRDAESTKGRALEELHEARRTTEALQRRHEDLHTQARKETAQALAVAERRHQELAAARSVHAQEIMQVSRGYQVEIDSLRRALEGERSQGAHPASPARQPDVEHPAATTRTVLGPIGP